MSSEKFAIGVDLGGTKIEAAAVDDTGRIKRNTRCPTDAQNGPSAVTQQVVELVRQLCREYDASPSGVGVGVAGQVVAGTGVVHFAPNLVWHHVPLQANLVEALNMPVRVDNDVRMAAWGEWLFGAGRGCDDLICIYVGTGVGGGIVSGGRMLTGHSNTAGEIGHITIDLNGPICTCGKQGCLEAIAGGWAIARKAQAAATKNPLVGAAMLKLAGNRISQITAEVVARAYNQKDPLAIRIINDVVEALVGGTVSMVNMCNPERIILGGGVIEGLPEMIGRVGQGVRQRALTAAAASLQVLPAELGGAAGVVGAAAMVMRNMSP
ncbi:MAG: ROK family protein [Desulfobacteraceae bacterium]|nr:MAG: ROK family protein [Desulfobacteraceae bacterium]